MTNREDARFIKDSIKDDISLPESLSKENITQLVFDVKQKKSRKGTVRRLVSVAVAACIVLTSAIFISEHGVNYPNAVEQNDNVAVQNSTFASYDELLAKIKEYAKQYKDYITSDGYDFFYSGTVYNYSQTYDDIAVNSAVAEETADMKNYGEVNLRESGVNEADIMITDGEYIYTVDLYLQRINIIKAGSDGSLERVWSESVDKEDANRKYYRGLYRYENYLVVGFTENIETENYVKSLRSGVIIYDVSDKTAPSFVKEISLDGAYVSSRITDGRLILISSYSIMSRYEDEDVYLIPGYYEGDVRKTVPCDCIYFESTDAAESYVNIMNASLTDLDKEAEVTAFLGKTAETYCTKDTLYIIGYEYKYKENSVITAGDTVTNGVVIPAFSEQTKITAVDISEEKAKIRCYTEFDGTVLNSYSIDEYNGYLRVAVQKSDENCIFIFDKNLGKVGELTGIAEGELIKSARFMGDTAYLVTFLQTDPLFVIDLSDPEKPEAVGELKIPGFSSYLHPVGEGLLIGIGQGGTLTGVDGSSKISLFDVSDPNAPKETDSLIFPTSQLGTDAKAFCGVSENSFLVTYENWTVEDKYYDDGNLIANYIYTGALYVAVENGKLVLKNSYLAKNLEATTRTTFIGDNVYIFSEAFGCLASFDMETGMLISSLEGEKGEKNIKYTVPDSANGDILDMQIVY